MPEPLEITSHLRTYSVSFVETLAEIAGEISSPGDFFIADPVVAEIVWGESPPEDRLLLVEPSEERKTVEQVQKVVQWLVEARFRRGGTLVAIGGGVIQDLTAFTASSPIQAS